ncbi:MULTISPECIES: peptidase M15 [unclassified Bradyrhizobium]|uniref:peptidase M15 n=1 Tax=unclassified Bradyrhizobium TaxID=2631580 RepID=UPI001FF04C5B|nr:MULTISPECIES: peptidase M15 [unclassified Bradyrhizobium]
MNPRWATLAVVCREAAIPALVLAWIGTSSFAAVYNTRAAPIVERLAPSLAADAKFTDIKFADNKFADRMPPVASGTPDFPPPSDLSIASDLSLASIPATVAVTPDATPAPAAREPEPIVTASLTDPSEMLLPETPPEPAANTNAVNPGVASREPGDVNQGKAANQGAGSIEVFDECFAVDVCVDRYLWALYQRTPKEDTVKIEEQRKVTIKRKGKRVTVTRTFTTRADQDFGWKDPKAAEKAGMSMADYVIGGMDRDFKLKLFHMLHVAEEIGMSPGITSAFRDDYRQSIASGLKAASDRSYHGGSLRGGYGHGLAADIVSINGATRAQRLMSSQVFWKWVDEHGKDFGVGRPYLDHDPPHVGPIDGKEYADKHPKARQAETAAKPAHRVVKRVRTARS